VVLGRFLAHALLFRVHVDRGGLKRGVAQGLLQDLERHSRRRGLRAERVPERVRRGLRQLTPRRLEDVGQLLDQPAERATLRSSAGDAAGG
jgi:hypothetical protein